MTKLVYTINGNGYVAVIEKSSPGANLGVVNSANPLILCMRDDLIKYYPSQPSTSEVALINVRASMEAHVAEKLIEATALDLLPSATA